MNQKVGEYSIGLQANRDIIFNDYSQIKQIFNDLYKLNFPELVSIASKKAIDNMEEYLTVFLAKITPNDKDRIQNNLGTPNGQYIINDSIKNAARYGNTIDLSMLADSVISSLKNNGDIFCQLYQSASEVIPKLGKNQMQLILTHFYIHSLSFKISTVNELEIYTMKIFSNFSEFTKISNLEREYLSSIGIFSANPIFNDTGISFMNRKYNPEMNKIIKEYYDDKKIPTVRSVIEYYDMNQLVKYIMTSIGKVISLLMIKKEIPDITEDLIRNA